MGPSSSRRHAGRSRGRSPLRPLTFLPQPVKCAAYFTGPPFSFQPFPSFHIQHPKFKISLPSPFVTLTRSLLVDSLCLPFGLPTAVYLATLGCLACGGLRPSAPSARALRCSLTFVKKSLAPIQNSKSNIKHHGLRPPHSSFIIQNSKVIIKHSTSPAAASGRSPLNSSKLCLNSTNTSA